EVDAGLVYQACGCVIVSCKRGDRFALAFHFGQCRHCDFGEGRAVLGKIRSSGEIGQAHCVSSAAPRTQDAARTRASIRSRRAGSTGTNAGKARCYVPHAAKFLVSRQGGWVTARARGMAALLVRE